VEEMCDKVHWIDGEWPPSLKNSLVRLWGMYKEERDDRIHGNVEYSTQNYQLVLEKRELEKKNMELHKSLGNAWEHVAEMTTHDLELERSMRKKAEDTVARLKEDKKKHEVYIADLVKLVHVQKDKMKKISEICGE
jgi:bifunctional N-acetylglucosamine-1-phosphate-uridyltransferase/glucosamine-1-phosphate-acetyltransferase GlmU-like protein